MRHSASMSLQNICGLSSIVSRSENETPTFKMKIVTM